MRWSESVRPAVSWRPIHVCIVYNRHGASREDKAKVLRKKSKRNEDSSLPSPRRTCSSRWSLRSLCDLQGYACLRTSPVTTFPLHSYATRAQNSTVQQQYEESHTYTVMSFYSTQDVTWSRMKPKSEVRSNEASHSSAPVCVHFPGVVHLKYTLYM